jgi:hypothetical protein
MAFNKENWETRTGHTKGPCVRTFSYWNEDADTITAAGYFPNTLGLRTGDMIEVIDSASGTWPLWYAITVSTAGVPTAAAVLVPKASVATS